MIDGTGNPNTSREYRDSVEALFSVSYTLKFMIKKGKQAADYGVLPLEGLWWADNMNDFVSGNKDAWKWTSMIMQPEKLITNELVKDAIEIVKKKKNPSALSKLRFEAFNEGLSVQILHLGPYSAEKSTVEKLHTFIMENGFAPIGKHHEIYLSDPSKSTPEKLKTIVRQPVTKK